MTININQTIDSNMCLLGKQTNKERKKKTTKSSCMQYAIDAPIVWLDDNGSQYSMTAHE